MSGTPNPANRGRGAERQLFGHLPPPPPMTSTAGENLAKRFAETDLGFGFLQRRGVPDAKSLGQRDQLVFLTVANAWKARQQVQPAPVGVLARAWAVRLAWSLVAQFVIAMAASFGLLWRRMEQLPAWAVVLSIPIFSLLVGLLCGSVTEKHGLPRPAQMRWLAPLSAVLVAIGMSVVGVVVTMLVHEGPDAALAGLADDPLLMVAFFTMNLTFAALGTSGVGPFTSLRNNPPRTRYLAVTIVIVGVVLSIGGVLLLGFVDPSVTLVVGLVGSVLALVLCAWLNEVVCRPGPPPNPADPSGLGLQQWAFEEFFGR